MYFMESPVKQIDDLLRRVCFELQISAPKFEEIERRYNAVGAWLAAPGSPLSEFGPAVYVQGSGAIGTLNQPLKGGVSDIDGVCELTLMDWNRYDALSVLDAFERRMREHATYEWMIERKNRCIRIIYKNRFHLDILPAAPVHRGVEGGPLKVPCQQAQDWKDSSPKGYASWFLGRSALFDKSVRLDERGVEALPDHQSLAEKSPLQLVVQLLKRRRDIAFENQEPELAPISIVLTTLAGHFYQGERSLVAAMNSILDGISNAINQVPRGSRLIVRNPVNQNEDLSERWGTTQGAYNAFFTWFFQFKNDWHALQEMRSIPQASLEISRLFGETVTNAAVKKQAIHLDEIRNRNGLNVTQARGGIVLAGSAFSTAIKTNTFFGGRHIGRESHLRKKSLALQDLKLRSAFSQFYRRHSPNPHIYIWEGKIHSGGLCEEYLVQILYNLRTGIPEVRILSPTLKERDGEPIPHVYPGNRLCLYLPFSGEWCSNKFLADTVVPWISLWLFYYEAWLATGEWLGGGKHPAPGHSKRAA